MSVGDITEPGRRVRFAANLSGTSAETVYTCNNPQGAIAVAMQICDVGASPVDVTVAIVDASGPTTYRLINTYSIANKEFLTLDLLGIPLNEGDSIEVTESSAGDVEIIGVVKELYVR